MTDVVFDSEVHWCEGDEPFPRPPTPPLTPRKPRLSSLPSVFRPPLDRGPLRRLAVLRKRRTSGTPKEKRRRRTESGRTTPPGTTPRPDTGGLCRVPREYSYLCLFQSLLIDSPRPRVGPRACLMSTRFCGVGRCLWTDERKTFQEDNFPCRRPFLFGVV